MTNGDNGGTLMDEVLRTVALEYHWKELEPPERAVAAPQPGATRSPRRQL